MSRVAVRVAFGVLVVLLAGCQAQSRDGNSNLPPGYQSGAEIRDALDRAGLGCQDFQSISRDRRDIGDKDAVETDVCRVGNTDISINIWPTLGQAQDWARSRQATACGFAKSLGSPPPVYVDGGRWTIALSSRDVATEIAKAVGGKAVFADCRSMV